MLYQHWLNLKTHLLWCYDARRQVDRDVKFPVFETRAYRNNGAWLVCSGWAEVELDDTCFRANPGEWLILPPRSRIQRFKPGTVLVSIAFDAEWVDGMKLLNEGLPVLIQAADYPELEKTALRMIDVMDCTPAKRWNLNSDHLSVETCLLLDAKLMIWLRELIRVLEDQGISPQVPDAKDKRLEEALLLLNRHPLDMPFVIDHLAEQVGLSPIHLNRLFRRELGKTAQAVFTQRRLTTACRLIKMKQLRINEIARELGFNYLSHFSKWFKERTGYSPQKYQ